MHEKWTNEHDLTFEIIDNDSVKLSFPNRKYGIVYLWVRYKDCAKLEHSKLMMTERNGRFVIFERPIGKNTNCEIMIIEKLLWKGAVGTLIPISKDPLEFDIRDRLNMIERNRGE